MKIDELQALPDAELNTLAAKLRGWTVAFGGIEVAGEIVREHHFEGRDENGELGAIISVHDWTPATNRNQSGELLEWFVETQWKGLYAIRSGKLFRNVHLTAWIDGDDMNIEVNGTGAKAETIAFCAAMLAMEGGSE